MVYKKFKEKFDFFFEFFSFYNSINNERNKEQEETMENKATAEKSKFSNYKLYQLIHEGVRFGDTKNVIKYFKQIDREFLLSIREEPELRKIMGCCFPYYIAILLIDFTDGKGLFPIIKSCLREKGIEIEEKYYIFLWCVGITYRYASTYNVLSGEFEYSPNLSIIKMLEDEEVHSCIRCYSIDEFRIKAYQIRMRSYVDLFKKMKKINLKWLLHKKDINCVAMPKSYKCPFCSSCFSRFYYIREHLEDTNNMCLIKAKEEGLSKVLKSVKENLADISDSKYWV